MALFIGALSQKAQFNHFGFSRNQKLIFFDEKPKIMKLLFALLMINLQTVDQIFQTLESQIANPQWIETQAYQDFKKEMYSKETLALDEEAFRKKFNQASKQLPFTHLYLKSKKKPTESVQDVTRSPAISWTEIDQNTAYLKIQSFSGRAADLIPFLGEIGVDRYDNLIIDLQGNTGGALEIPIVLGQFLTNQSIDGGCYLTRAWFETFQRNASREEIQDMPYLQDFSYEGITKMYAESKAFRMVIPGHNRPVFQGNVYVLQDDQTASAGEPLLDLIQRENIGILLGETSNGAMLSGYFFPIGEDYELFLPIADYQNALGNRLDKVGVRPDVETVNPLSKALELIKISKV